MSDAPYPVTMIILGTMFVAAILGGIFAAVLNSVAGFTGISLLSGVVGGALASFAASAIGGKVRARLAQDAATGTSVDGKPVVYAYPLQTRLIILAVLSLAFAVFVLSIAGMSLSFLSGAFISLLTAIVATFIFSSKMLSK